MKLPVFFVGEKWYYYSVLLYLFMICPDCNKKIFYSFQNQKNKILQDKTFRCPNCSNLSIVAANKDIRRKKDFIILFILFLLLVFFQILPSKFFTYISLSKESFVIPALGCAISVYFLYSLFMITEACYKLEKIQK